MQQKGSFSMPGKHMRPIGHEGGDGSAHCGQSLISKIALFMLLTNFVKIGLRHAVSVLVLNVRTGIFLFWKKALGVNICVKQ